MQDEINNLIQLKAAAYDSLAQIEWHQRELARLNALIVEAAAKGNVLALTSEPITTPSEGE